MKLYTTDILQEISIANMLLINEKFSKDVIDRINKSFSKKKKLRQVTTRLMLVKIFKNLGIDPKNLKTMYYSKEGKLMIPNNDSLHLSISYCNNKAICGISKSAIGIDIEDLRKKVLNKNRRLLERFTKTKIESSLDFYKTWTAIESIAKTYEKGGLNKLFTDENFLKKRHNTKHILLEDSFLIAISS